MFFPHEGGGPTNPRSLLEISGCRSGRAGADRSLDSFAAVSGEEDDFSRAQGLQWCDR